MPRLGLGYYAWARARGIMPGLGLGVLCLG